jgi:hypothetical protein
VPAMTLVSVLFCWRPRRDLNSCCRRESGLAKRNSNEQQEHERTGWRSRSSKKHLIVSPLDRGLRLIVTMHAVTIPAPRAAVWQALTTSAGSSTWLTPGAVVELRPGGEWTAHFPVGKTGGGTIVSFVPEGELVLSVMAPEQCPIVRAERTRVRFQFETKGPSTIVQLLPTPANWTEEW